MTLSETLGMGVGSLEQVRAALGAPRPASTRDLLDRYQAPIDFAGNLVTPGGVPLGGHYALQLQRDGSFRFTGDVRATGFPSFSFAVRVTVGADLAAQAVMIASGRVHGTNEIGDRQVNWNQSGQSPPVALNWLDFKRAHAPSVDFERDVSIFGDVGSVVTFLAELYASYALGGATGECLMLGSAAANQLDVGEKIGIGGLAGVAAAGAVLAVFGQGAIVAALVAGIAAGVAVDNLVRHRTMHDDEFAFADRVFHGTLPRDRIVLTNLYGIGGRPFTIPVAGNTILVNLGAGFDHPMTYTGYGDPDHPPTDPNHTQAAGELFIHELTHAWQIAHSGFVPGWVCSELGTQTQGHAGYVYGPPGPPFGEFNFERQAKIVDEWFGGTGRQKYDGNNQDMGGCVESDRNPYYRYIRDNIRVNLP
jgi:hypothetical protein